jgi:uncharacterized membrane protein
MMDMPSATSQFDTSTSASELSIQPAFIRIYVGVMALSTLAVVIDLLQSRLGKVTPFLVVPLILFQFVLLRGVWRQREWARILAIMAHGLNITGKLLGLLFGFSMGAILAIVVQVFVIYWFLLNSDSFTQ